MIRNIWAVGRNYADHAKELGNSVPTEGPLIFLKAGSTAVTSEVISLPKWTEQIHHEIELALQLDQNLEIAGVGLALDLTERKKQSELKSLGQPWTLAKSFQNSCPLTDFKPLPQNVNWDKFQIELFVNGEKRQQGSSEQMIFPVPILNSYIQAHFPVVPQDVLLTGTPAGVGPLLPGDLVRGTLRYNSELWVEKSWTVAR